MKIETKYDVGQKIWDAYEKRGEVCVYTDTIMEIYIDKGKEIVYSLSTSYEEIKEKDVILYGDEKKLLERIKKIMAQIEDKESEEKNEFIQ